MTRTRNLELWLEILDRYPVFNDEEHPSYNHAYQFIETLMNGNRLNSRDIICLDGLLGIIHKYRDGD